jgi:hypothetical protein
VLSIRTIQNLQLLLQAGSQLIGEPVKSLFVISHGSSADFIPPDIQLSMNSGIIADSHGFIGIGVSQFL